MARVVHYHGGPIWGLKGEVAKIAWAGAGAFVSYHRPDQLELALTAAAKVWLDNGAFSVWKKGIEIDWNEFWAFAEKYIDRLDAWVVPDVIEGSERDNDLLIEQCPNHMKKGAVPVWHMHESLERLLRLAEDWPRIAFGSSGEYSRPKSAPWHSRIAEAFDCLANADGSIPVYVHMMRGLDRDILSEYPFRSGDSTNLARNVPLDSSFPRGPSCKLERAKIIKERIEQSSPPKIWLGGLRSIQTWQNKVVKQKVSCTPKAKATDPNQQDLF